MENKLDNFLEELESQQTISNSELKEIEDKHLLLGDILKFKKIQKELVKEITRVALSVVKLDVKMDLHKLHVIEEAFEVLEKLNI